MPSCNYWHCALAGGSAFTLSRSARHSFKAALIAVVRPTGKADLFGAAQEKFVLEIPHKATTVFATERR